MSSIALYTSYATVFCHEWELEDKSRNTLFPVSKVALLRLVQFIEQDKTFKEMDKKAIQTIAAKKWPISRVDMNKIKEIFRVAVPALDVAPSSSTLSGSSSSSSASSSPTSSLPSSSSSASSSSASSSAAISPYLIACRNPSLKEIEADILLKILTQ